MKSCIYLIADMIARDKRFFHWEKRRATESFRPLHHELHQLRRTADPEQGMGIEDPVLGWSPRRKIGFDF
ncbi:MAG: hypothetical protein P8X63_15065, partial [Desulfuromonadaceae bacterium]